MNLFDGFLQQLGTGDQIRDWKHASRLFIDNNYALSPKYDWLFHVFIDVNPAVSRIQDPNSLKEHGMLVKSSDLPKFTVDNKTLNNYNRPNIVQTKIKYDPINITFHDDQSNKIRTLWYDYYNYYYRDTDTGFAGSSGAPNPSYYAESKYVPAQPISKNFGYTPRAFTNSNQYINNIQIYSLHKKRFSLYVLINPVITSFSHGTHSTGANGMLENTMTIAYESVLYGSGYVTANTVKGFADLHYDKSPSPLTPAGGGTNSILGPGGILSTMDEVIADGGSGTTQGYGSAAFKLFRGYQKNKNVDLRGLAKQELYQAGMDILNMKDPRDRFYVPYAGATANKIIPEIGSNPQASGGTFGSIISNGLSVNLGLGGSLAVGAVAAAAGGGSLAVGAAVAGVAALSAIGKPSTSSTSVPGLNVNSSGQASGATLNQVVNVDATGAVTGAEAQVNPNFFGSVLSYLQKARQSQVAQKQAQTTASTDVLGTNQLSALPQGVSSAASLTTSAVKTFATGTSTILTGMQGGAGQYGQTPYASSVVAQNTEVSNAEAERFITNNNYGALTPDGYQAPNNNYPQNPVSI